MAIFGIPNKGEMQRFGAAIWDRADENGADRKLAYADRLVDRIINKARGILPFNSLVVAIEALVLRSSAPKWEFMIYGSTALLAISSLVLLLNMFWAHFGEVDDYMTIKSEFDCTMVVVRKRAIALQWATVLSITGLLSAMAALAPFLGCYIEKFPSR